jgi:glycosyltransferase involved in cell wall biosynthesis
MVGYQLLVGLARAGHRVRAIAPITPAAFDAGDNFARDNPGVTVSRFLVPFFNSSPDQALPSNYLDAEDAAVRDAFRSAVAANRPDIVIIGRESFAQSLPELALAHEIPSMLLVQGGGLAGMLHNFAPAQRDHLIDQFKKVDRVVSVARHLMAGLRALGLTKVTFIANQVDLRKFSPAPKSRLLLTGLGLRDDQFIVVHISNLKRLKRVSDLVLSAREMVRRVPHVRYVIVGDGICRSQLETKCRAAGLSDYFRFVGWVEHDSVPEYINLADVVLMPSETEAAALVYLETQACARLLIASDIPGAREIVRDNETALLFAMGDIDDLAANLLLAAADPGLRERIGRAARESVKRYNLERFVAEYQRVIRETVEQTFAGVQRQSRA